MSGGVLFVYVDARSVERTFRRCSGQSAYESFSAACYGASKRDTSHCPSIIATTNKITLGDPEARAANAGPGQKPASPQPAPKTAAPRTSGRSNRVLVGRVNCAASNGFGRRRIIGKIGTVMTSAPAMTSSNVGSQ